MKLQVIFDGHAHETTWNEWASDNADAFHPDELDEIKARLDHTYSATTVDGCELTVIDDVRA